MGNILIDNNGNALLSNNKALEVTSTIDSNIQAGNIKKDVTILGVTGTYEGSGGGGSNEMRFPHEIGIFLGYPLADVTGFINNKGRNCKCIGTWKVYGDASSASKAFARFNKCSDVYNRLWKSGRIQPVRCCRI